jgi:hypothetical protein
MPQFIEIYEIHLMPQFQKSELKRNFKCTIDACLLDWIRQKMSRTRRIAVCKRTLSKLSIIT